ncbi:MAG: autotransporter outer membrane beta-barrel domain-containing protein [Acidobacteria bacterium]|nr:autotransporter outer membrane beta-barrel domain-containing protein [Acidobacteriota bacterium]
MKLVKGIVFVIWSGMPLMAFPQYLALFTEDVMSSPQFKNRCATCHINPAGGGPRNDFGQAFAANNFSITPELRARFPERFQYPRQVIDEHIEIDYADPSNKKVVLKKDGVVRLIDPSHPPGSGAAANVVGEAISVTAGGGVSEWDRPLQVSSRWINLPQPVAVHRNDVSFVVQHRFSAPLFVGSAPQLFGLDSTANISLGFNFWIWEHVMASIYRARFDRVVEIGVAGDLWQQQRGNPVSLAAQIGVDGRDNFGDFYSPHLQVTVARQFGRRVGVLLAPAVIFNSQSSTLSFLRDFATKPDKDYTVNLGAGLSAKVTPSVSIVGEYIPRVAGFRGYFTDRPALSVALQKQTFRHVFSVVMSTSREVSIAGYGPNIGTDASDTANRLKIGFNIFRKLR